MILAWAALRQRAWYQHGGSIPAPRPGGARPDMELRPEPLPAPGDWQAATSRAESLFGIHVNPYLTAAGLTELTGSIRSHVDALADAAVALVPRIEDAYRHAGLAEGVPGRLATARAAAGLVQALQRAEQPGPPHRDASPGRPCLPPRRPWRTRCIRPHRYPARCTRSGGIGSRRCARPSPLTDQRGRAAAGILQDLREALTADEFATRLEPALSRTDDAIFEWLASGQPKPVDEPPVALRPDDVHLRLPASRRRAAKRHGPRERPPVTCSNR